MTFYDCVLFSISQNTNLINTSIFSSGLSNLCMIKEQFYISRFFNYCSHTKIFSRVILLVFIKTVSFVLLKPVVLQISLILDLSVIFIGQICSIFILVICYISRAILRLQWSIIHGLPVGNHCSIE